eukprot:gnl/TRDRNA2_/TRDRNA2_128386_c1_seq1.p1 gnl/TRDRNA2_/TRDRNA2_128386_c1~~gnl/TRDRNA2_/TRDRNA2_128386_c1_seq1.p1  ORF type:complete len:789 (+),score=127.81 gnl/TRDRNA2_/TRDRNA2_128386_c1_seq1:118-2367(+)
MAHEHTTVPQPVYLDWLTATRREERQNYALASQLAKDGHVDGIAAKAEMLYYGKEHVVPGGAVGGGWATSASCTVGLAILLALMLAPRAARCTAARCQLCQKRRPARKAEEIIESTVAGSVISTAESAPESADSALAIWVFCFRAALVAAFAVAWYWTGPWLAPLGSLPRDEDAASDLFEEAATAGHWGAAYALAMIKLDGPNRSEATPWLQQVAEQGDDTARAVARHFQHKWGLGEEHDPYAAGQLLQDAAESGDPNAALLLAEAHAHDGPGHSDVEPPGGRNLDAAVDWYRRAARAGRVTCRYNIGVLLLKRHAGRPPEGMPLPLCAEARAEFAAVATDLDPTLRLLFALAMRAWELGDSTGALRVFMFLSEAGSEKAHSNAAHLWEAFISSSSIMRTWAGGDSAVEATALEDTEAERTNCSLGHLAAAGEEASGPTFNLVHEGLFCCGGGDCDAAVWLLNEGGLDPLDCASRCSADLKCKFATIYFTGYCQLSTDCAVTYAADDTTARTYEVLRPPPAPPPCKLPPPTTSLSDTKKVSCWLPGDGSPHDTSDTDIRRCAILFHVRSARLASSEEQVAAAGSAAHGSAIAAESAALAAAGHMQLLGLHESAHLWACFVARRFASDHGRLLCAALEAEHWPGHPRNLSAAMGALRELEEHGGQHARIAALGVGLWLHLRFACAAAMACRFTVNGASCPDLEQAAASWSLDPSTVPRAVFERWLSVFIVAAALVLLSSAWVGLKALRRL